MGVFQVPDDYSDEQVKTHIQRMRISQPEIFQGAGLESARSQARSVTEQQGQQITDAANTPKPTMASRFGEVTGISSLPQFAREAVTNPVKTLGGISEGIGQYFQPQNKTENVLSMLDPTGGALVAGAKIGRDITGGPQFAEDVAEGRPLAAAGDILGGIANTLGPKIMQSARPVQRARQALQNRYASPERAGKLYERAIAPSNAEAFDQEAMRQDFKQASPYIAQETRGYPLTQPKGGAIDVPSGVSKQTQRMELQGGAMRSSGIARRSANNLWDRTITPVVDTFADATRPVNDVAEAIRGTISEIDAVKSPGKVSATQKLADFFDQKQNLTVKEMNELVKEFNNEKAIGRFYELSPTEQMQAQLADPALQGKVAALKSLRLKLFDTIADAGGEALGTGFQNARRDYGSLVNVEEAARRVRVPTPQPLLVRAANTLRGFVGMRGMGVYASGVPETLGHLQDPDRLLARSFSMLGRTDLKPPALNAAWSGANRFPPGIKPDVIDAEFVDLGGVPAARRQRPFAPQPRLNPFTHEVIIESEPPTLTGFTAGQPSSGPRTVEGPGQWPIQAAESTRRPLTGPERQLPSAGQTSPPKSDVPPAQTKVNQTPPPLQPTVNMGKYKGPAEARAALMNAKPVTASQMEDALRVEQIELKNRRRNLAPAPTEVKTIAKPAAAKAQAELKVGDAVSFHGRDKGTIEHYIEGKDAFIVRNERTRGTHFLTRDMMNKRNK